MAVAIIVKRPSTIPLLVVVSVVIAITLFVVTESQQLRGPRWLQSHRSLLPQCLCDESDHAAIPQQRVKANTGDRLSWNEFTQDGAFKDGGGDDDCCRRKDMVSPRPLKADSRSRRKTATSSKISFNFQTKSHGPKQRQIIPSNERTSWRIRPPNDDSHTPMPSSFVSTKEQVRAPAWLWPPIWFPTTQSPEMATCLPTTLPTAIESSVDTTVPMVANIDSRAPSPPTSPDPVSTTTALPFGSPFTWLDPVVDSPSIPVVVPRVVPLNDDAPPPSLETETKLPTCDIWQFDPHSTAEPTGDETVSPPVSWWDKNPTCDPLATSPVTEIAPITVSPFDSFEPTLPAVKTKDTTSRPNIMPIELPETANPSPVPSLLDSSGDPSIDPTDSPTCNTNDLTDIPTLLPFSEPSIFPTMRPIEKPSGFPSSSPTALPTVFPTELPSVFPSLRPTFDPTISPSVRPTPSPSQIPSAMPSSVPSIAPSLMPSVSLTTRQTSTPSVQPSDAPSEVSSNGSSPSASPITTEKRNPSSQLTANEFDESSCEIWAYENCVAKDYGGNWDRPCKTGSFGRPPESIRMIAAQLNPLEEMEPLIAAMSSEEQIRVRSSLVVIYQEILDQHYR